MRDTHTSTDLHSTAPPNENTLNSKVNTAQNYHDIDNSYKSRRRSSRFRRSIYNNPIYGSLGYGRADELTPEGNTNQNGLTIGNFTKVTLNPTITLYLHITLN